MKTVIIPVILTCEDGPDQERVIRRVSETIKEAVDNFATVDFPPSIGYNVTIMTPSGKLVRDLAPERMRADGETPVCRTPATAQELRDLAGMKLFEEALEFALMPSLEKLADVAEVLALIRKLYAWEGADVLAAQAEKRKTHGAFDNRIVLVGVER